MTGAAGRERELLAANTALLDRARRAEAEAARLREASTVAAKQFRRYQRDHWAKNTAEGNAKARTNREMAERLERALSGEEDKAEQAREDWLRVRHAARVTVQIATERDRQIRVEGWSADHDDSHDRGELAQAAACYAAHAALASRDGLDDATPDYDAAGPPSSLAWPWDARWWKPKDRRRDLVRAAALIIAEIERLDRALTGEPADG